MTTRRTILGGAAGAVAAVTLGGCSTSTEPPIDHGDGGGTLPSFEPFTGLEPDLPAGPNGTPSGYLSYPADPPTYAEVPLAIPDTITVMGPTSGVGPPKDSSAWWQNLQQILDIDLEMNLVPGTELAAKQQAMLAGGDIPDIAIINPNSVPLGALHEYFADLGPFLSGDRASDYPALAAIPTLAWRTPMIDGTLFGIPQPRIPAGYTLGIRQDLMGGGDPITLDDGDDLLALFTEMTDERNSRWAYGQDPYFLFLLVLEMHGVANGANAWMEDNGSFTSMWESPAVIPALEFIVKVMESGVVHPDAIASPSLAWFSGGTVLSHVNDFAAYGTIVSTSQGIEVELIPVPRWEGGGLAVKQLNAGASGVYAAFRKADTERIEQLLSFVNYLAAPMGTSEYLNVNYGKEGESYNRVDGDPVLTSSGQADALNAGALNYVTTQRLNTLYNPGLPELTRKQHEYLTAVMQQTQANPAIGLYSESLVSAEGSSASSALTDVLNDIMRGRQDISAWEPAVDTWRDDIGDQARGELEEAFSESDY